MDELRRFAESTSMKGVPRLVRADTYTLRLLWALGVLVFLGVSLSQTYVLVNEFLKYTTVTQVLEVHLDPFSGSHHDTLPDINLCNLNPLSSNNSRARWLPTLAQYYQVVREETACVGCNLTEGEAMEELRVDLLTVSGYYRYIGRENASRVGHVLEDMVLSCHLYVVDGINKRKVPCKDIVRLLYFQNSQYFRCINIHITPKANAVAILGISLVLFLDNFDEDPGETFNSLDDSGQSAGVALGIHHRNSIPALTLNTMEVPAGQKVNIRVTPESRRRLPPPHGTCEVDAAEFLHGVGKVPFPSFRYTYPSCLLTCLESHLNDGCGCISGKNVDLGNYQNISVDYCGNLRAGWRQAMQTYQCRNRMHNQALKQCIHVCPSRCLDFYYGLSMSHSIWPRNSRILSFYKHFIRDKPYAHYFSAFETILNKNKSSQYSPGENIKFLLAADSIRDNFVDLSVSLKDYRYIALKDAPKVSFEGLVSQLGGILNLWSGISAIIAIEIIEFLYRLLVYMCKDQRKGDVSTELDQVKKDNFENSTAKI